MLVIYIITCLTLFYYKCSYFYAMILRVLITKNKTVFINLSFIPDIFNSYFSADKEIWPSTRSAGGDPRFAGLGLNNQKRIRKECRGEVIYFCVQIYNLIENVSIKVYNCFKLWLQSMCRVFKPLVAKFNLMSYYLTQFYQTKHNHLLSFDNKNSFKKRTEVFGREDEF